MRITVPTIFLSLVALSASAALPETGYYRVQNNKTKRYVYVRDDKGEINVGATTADYNAIWLLLGEDRTHYDPSGIIRLNHKSGNEYDIEAQGTSVHKLIEMYPHIYEYKGSYRIGGTAQGTTKYLCDGEANLEKERSFPSDGGSSAAIERRQWDIFPVADSYFGIKPEIQTTDGTHYATFYADFPYAVQSQGMKLYAVTKTGRGMAAYREVTGIIPPATPLLVECTGATPSDNRITIGGTANANVSDNTLTGVFFNNTLDQRHWNVVEYKPATMRVLGLTSDGTPGFITAGSELKYIPANTAYLTVSEGTDAELRLVTEDEFDKFAAIDDISADDTLLSIAVNGLDITVSMAQGAYTAAMPVEVIDIAGRTVTAATLPSSGTVTLTLPSHGLYILRTPASARKLHL